MFGMTQQQTKAQMNKDMDDGVEAVLRDFIINPLNHAQRSYKTIFDSLRRVTVRLEHEYRNDMEELIG